MTNRPDDERSPVLGDARRLEGFRRDYRVAFLRYLPRREEVALAAGYELGRSALSAGVSALAIVRIHHDVLAEVLLSSRPDEGPDSLREVAPHIVELAADFLSEVLAAADMVQRSLLEHPPLTGPEQPARPRPRR